MTSRFARLSITKQVTAIVILGLLSTFAPANAAAAQTEQNKNAFVFEIKNLKLTPTDIADAINGKDTEPEPKIETTVTIEVVEATPAPVIKSVAKKIAYVFPPKTTGDARVYMHEPEIRAYVCPKLGNKCNIFIAILKGENGTHECTRDNRGMNRNGSVDIGLAQINWKPGYPHSFEQLQDCKYNLDVALSMYARRGFQPWYAYTKGSYLKHMPAVLASAKTIAATEAAALTEQTPTPQ